MGGGSDRLPTAAVIPSVCAPTNFAGAAAWWRAVTSSDARLVAALGHFCTQVHPVDFSAWSWEREAAGPTTHCLFAGPRQNFSAHLEFISRTPQTFATAPRHEFSVRDPGLLQRGNSGKPKCQRQTLCVVLRRSGKSAHPAQFAFWPSVHLLYQRA